MQSAVVGGTRGLKAGSYSKAKAAYDKGLTVDTSNKIYMARLYFLRATLHESYDQFDEAIEDCGRCIDLQPSHKQAWATRGQLRLAKEDWAGGVQDLEEAYSLQPSPQTFAQLEEARRKKSLASKRKQKLSDSGGRSAGSHRTDQEGLQSKGQRVPPRQTRHGSCGGEGEDGVEDERDSGCPLLSLRPRQEGRL